MTRGPSQQKDGQEEEAGRHQDSDRDRERQISRRKVLTALAAAGVGLAAGGAAFGPSARAGAHSVTESTYGGTGGTSPADGCSCCCVNIIDYGAKGDGSDDAAAIQGALDAARAAGKKVWIPEGRFRIDTALSVPSHMVMDGTGELFTDVPNLNLIESIDTVNVTIMNIRLTGSGYGIQPPNTIGTPNIAGSGSGIVFAKVMNGRIENVKITRCGGDGNTPDRNGVAGVWLTFGCQNCRVVRCAVTHCRNAINEDNYYGLEPFDNTFDNNVAEDCRFGFVTDCTTAARGLKIINNTAKRCAYGGIDINKTGHVLVQGNTLEECGLTGQPGVFASAITVYGSVNFRVSHVSIYDNECYNNWGRGIKVAQNTYYCKIHDNTIVGSRNSGGILIQASRYYSVKGNTIVSCTGTALYCNPVVVGTTPVGIDQSIVEGNIIHNNTQHGIYMEQALNVNIRGNRINNNGLQAANMFYGIALASGSTGNIIDGNIVTGSNHKAGIAALDANSKKNIVVSNYSLNNAVNMQFVSQEQFFTNNGEDRTTSGSSYIGALDLKTGDAPIFLRTSSGVPSGTSGAEMVVDEANKLLYINCGGVWYKTDTLSPA
ncbi:right-handed parallel beta-helix repeat-containing protein [Paenibacillus hodogayensis]|uniref:Right-handed parallel beta-helix repeat-containing protein n=1 Tax=Paenibacillus hodogayensis TaxID=279208 RepID=A0ABV5VPU5_9BACL